METMKVAVEIFYLWLDPMNRRKYTYIFLTPPFFSLSLYLPLSYTRLGLDYFVIGMKHFLFSLVFWCHGKLAYTIETNLQKWKRHNGIVHVKYDVGEKSTKLKMKIVAHSQ